ncbi:PE-PGRS family protein [Strigomonas culicis]|uniref:PE-PGRS family protein n=1 Tax=Strigomonas culicis TaxID=28005 RepID=S9V034_9TRYP|nr:PE-PGRS family protein [Strigomonas culicis]|eukprot:EPY16100.1 PE-PGRS family protein [Strigomonas culicis]
MRWRTARRGGGAAPRKGARRGDDAKNAISLVGMNWLEASTHFGYFVDENLSYFSTRRAHGGKKTGVDFSFHFHPALDLAAVRGSIRAAEAAAAPPPGRARSASSARLTPLVPPHGTPAPADPMTPTASSSLQLARRLTPRTPPLEVRRPWRCCTRRCGAARHRPRGAFRFHTPGSTPVPRLLRGGLGGGATLRAASQAASAATPVAERQRTPTKSMLSALFQSSKLSKGSPHRPSLPLPPPILLPSPRGAQEAGEEEQALSGDDDATIMHHRFISRLPDREAHHRHRHRQGSAEHSNHSSSSLFLQSGVVCTPPASPPRPRHGEGTAMHGCRREAPAAEEGGDGAPARKQSRSEDAHTGVADSCPERGALTAQADSLEMGWQRPPQPTSGGSEGGAGAPPAVPTRAVAASSRWNPYRHEPTGDGPPNAHILAPQSFVEFSGLNGGEGGGEPRPSAGGAEAQTLLGDDSRNPSNRTSAHDHRTAPHAAAEQQQPSVADSTRSSAQTVDARASAPGDAPAPPRLQSRASAPPVPAEAIVVEEGEEKEEEVEGAGLRELQARARHVPPAERRQPQPDAAARHAAGTGLPLRGARPALHGAVAVPAGGGPRADHGAAARRLWRCAGGGSGAAARGGGAAVHQLRRDAGGGGGGGPGRLLPQGEPVAQRCGRPLGRAHALARAAAGRPRAAREAVSRRRGGRRAPHRGPLRGEGVGICAVPAEATARGG